MSFKIVRTLLKKELTDIFRDTKTIIIMVIVPMVLYPMIFLGSMLLTSSILKESTVKTYNVAIVANESDREFIRNLLDDALDKYEYHFEVSDLEGKEEYEELIRNSTYDAIIEAIDFKEEYPDINLYTMTSSNKSDTCRSMIEKVFDGYKKEIVENKLRDSLDDYDDLTKEPFIVNKKDFSSKEETTGMLIGYIMPFMMIISVLMGAFTVAIDISVGEKERGTLETLITLPVKNIDMMVSKFLAVSIFALFSVTINLLSFGLIGIYMYSSVKMASAVFGEFKIYAFIPSLLLMLVLMILFAFFVSALCLCVDFTAKSVKEANNYTTPLMLILMTGAGMSVIPGVKLTYIYALIPILNVSLLIKDLFMLKFDYTLIALVFASTLLHTMTAIFIMTKVFSSENILFSEGIKSVKLFEKRANMKEGQIPGIGDVVFMFVLMFLLSNFVGGYVALKFGFVGLIISQLIIFAIPVLYSWYIKVDFKNMYSLKVPHIKEVIGVLFFVSGAYIVNTVFVTHLIELFPKLAETNANLGNMIDTGGFLGSLIVVGMLPAVAEEAAFRGFLYGTLKNKKIPVIVTMIITAVVFAAYHMNWLQFIYVTFLGFIMSYLIYNSKSIFITVIFHLINNSFSVILQFKSEWFKNVSLLSNEHFFVKETLIFLSIGFALLAIGFFISDNRIGIFAHSKPSGKTLE